MIDLRLSITILFRMYIVNVAEPHPSVGRPDPSPMERGEKSGRMLPSLSERGWGDRRSGEALESLRH